MALPPYYGRTPRLFEPLPLRETRLDRQQGETRRVRLAPRLPPGSPIS